MFAGSINIKTPSNTLPTNMKLKKKENKNTCTNINIKNSFLMFCVPKIAKFWVLCILRWKQINNNP